MSLPFAIKDRFRGYLPVVVDIETAGFNANTDAILEIAAICLQFNAQGELELGERLSLAIEPFAGANLEQAALAFTGIDPWNPLRGAVDEAKGMQQIFQMIRHRVKEANCNRAIMVAHNAHFDHGFVNAAVERHGLKRNPFHPFSSFDTATLAGLAYGHTVLAKACKLAGIDFDNKEAHSAEYDAERTAELFCLIVNRWQQLGGLANTATTNPSPDAQMPE